MQLAKVIGSMVSTRKSDRLHGLKLLVAVPIDMDTFEEKGAPFITVDTVGAGEGEIVMWAGGSSSRQTDLTTNKPVDSSIVGIVDFVDILGKRVYDKVRHLTLEGEMTGEELIALDAADAGIGDIVLVNNDGGAAQMITGDKTLIASVTICGVVDCYTWQGKHVACH